jgi:AmpD protein
MREQTCAARASNNRDAKGLSGWIPGLRACVSPHADARPDPAEVSLVVLHHISLPPGRFSGDAVESLFMGQLDCSADPSFAALVGLRVSAHFFLRRRGTLIQFVDINKRAWHAGQSAFLGRTACNDFSVGIELEGDGWHDFTRAQYQRLPVLIRALCDRLPLRHICGHSDIAPGRKTDPGPRFDWPRALAPLADLGLEAPFVR